MDDKSTKTLIVYPSSDPDQQLSQCAIFVDKISQEDATPSRRGQEYLAERSTCLSNGRALAAKTFVHLGEFITKLPGWLTAQSEEKAEIAFDVCWSGCKTHPDLNVYLQTVQHTIILVKRNLSCSNFTNGFTVRLDILRPPIWPFVPLFEDCSRE